jgi:hypothetical protein
MMTVKLYPVTAKKTRFFLPILHLNSAIDTKGVRGDRSHRKRETWYRNGNLNCLANHLGVRLLVSTEKKNNPTKLSLLYCAKHDPFRTPA